MRAGTFSKIFGAGIRLGWTMSSRELRSVLMNYKLDGGTSPFSSRILTEYMRGHMFDSHRRACRRLQKQAQRNDRRLQKGWARGPSGVNPMGDSSYGSRFRMGRAPRRYAPPAASAECLSGTARSFDGTVGTIATFASRTASPLPMRLRRAWPSSATRSSDRRPSRTPS